MCRKARRERFSCGGADVFTSWLGAQERSSLTDSVPQRYPSCAASCRGWSTRSCEGSCAAGTETRSCRSGSGRSCCHHGCRACPVSAVSTVLRLPLRVCRQAFNGAWPSCLPVPHAMCLVFVRCVGFRHGLGRTAGARTWRNAPCQGRSSGRRRSRRRYACWRCWRLPGVSWGSETSRCSTICAASRLPWAFGRTISRVLTQRTTSIVATPPQPRSISICICINSRERHHS
jgi:hypothetical protein